MAVMIINHVNKDALEMNHLVSVKNEKKRD